MVCKVFWAELCLNIHWNPSPENVTGFTSWWMLNQKTQPSQRLREGRTYYYLKQVQTPWIFPKTVSPEQQNWRRFKLSFNMPFPKGLVCTPSHVQLFAIPWIVSARLLCPWDFLSKNTGVGCHFLLQEGAWAEENLAWNWDRGWQSPIFSWLKSGESTSPLVLHLLGGWAVLVPAELRDKYQIVTYIPWGWVRPLLQPLHSCLPFLCSCLPLLP